MNSGWTGKESMGTRYRWGMFKTNVSSINKPHPHTYGYQWNLKNIQHVSKKLKRM